MNTRRSYIYYLSSVAITIILVFTHAFLPEKCLLLVTSSDISATGSDGSKTLPEGNHPRLIPSYPKQVHCSITANATYSFCGVNIETFTSQQNWTVGRDFSDFDRLKLKFRYRGPADKLRAYLRNFDPNISRASDFNSAKYFSVNIRRIDFNSEIVIDMSDFRLSDWWLDMYQASMELTKGNFTRVTSLGIELAPPHYEGEHFLQIDSVEFVGNYVSAEKWYLSILIGWLLAVLIHFAVDLKSIYNQSRTDSIRIRHMEEYAQTLINEKNIYKNLSKTDPLTGILNRLGLMEIIELTDEWQHSNEDIAIVIIDLDHFKLINDNYGHHLGDCVLKSIASLLKENARSFDSVARWGGEEFLLFCPRTQANTAWRLAEKIRLKIANTVIPGAEDLKVTASFGISLVSPGEHFNHAFKRADHALYQAKNQGRNRCILHTCYHAALSP